jgi:molybdopterin converting factor small subunit
MTSGVYLPPLASSFYQGYDQTPEGMHMRVHIEFLGLARLATGLKELELDLENGATFRDMVRTLGTQYPALIGNVIQPDGETLQHPNRLNHNAKRIVQAHQMDERPSDGDRIIVMSISAGG